MRISNFNSDSIKTPDYFLSKLVAKRIPSVENITGFLVLSKASDFPGLL